MSVETPIPPDAAFAHDAPLGMLPNGKLNEVKETDLPTDIGPDPEPKE